MKPYKPSNIAPANGIQLLLLSSIGGAVVGGAVLGFIAQFVYLILLFPAVLGGAVGFAASIGVKSGKVRNPAIAGAVALLAGVVSYGSMNYVQYLTFRQSFAKEMISESLATEQNSDKAIDDFLQQEVKNSGFIGYMQFSAKQGVQISRSGRSSGIKLDQTFTLIYWLIELAIIEGLAVWLATSAAKEPFCEQSQDWYGEAEPFASADLADQDRLVEALNSDNYVQAGTMLKDIGEIAPPYLSLSMQTSPTPIYGSFLVVNRIDLDRKKNTETKELLQGLITAKQKSELVANLDETKEPLKFTLDDPEDDLPETET
jgi:hypothetical protein